MKTKEENWYKKVLIVVQNSNINLLLWPVVYRIIILYLQFTIVASNMPRRPYPTMFIQTKSSYYYFSLILKILIALSRTIDSD